MLSTLLPLFVLLTPDVVHVQGTKAMDYIDAHVHVWTSGMARYPPGPGFKKEIMQPPSFTPKGLFKHCKPAGVCSIVLIQISFYGFDNSYMLDMIAKYPDIFVGTAVIDPLGKAPTAEMEATRQLHRQQTAATQAHGEPPPTSRRLYEEFAYAAASWSQAWRVICKAEVMPAGDNPRFVATALAAPAPSMPSEDLYCARGTCENMIKAAKCDLHSGCPSDTTFLANAMWLLLTCAAYVLYHALRTQTLWHTTLAQAQPATVILTLCKVATLVRQYQDRIRLHLPRCFPAKGLLPRGTALLYAVPVLVVTRLDASNWSWLVDGLMEADSRMHLAHPAAMQP